VRDVLGVFLGRARSAREAADELGRDLDAVLYRVKRLQRAGLLVVVEERARGGRPIKVYRSAHDAWFVPFAALPYADVEETLTVLQVAQARRLARASARHLQRTTWAGFLLERREDGRVWMTGARDEGDAAERAAGERPVPLAGAHGGAMDALVELHLTTDEARSLNAELQSLVERYLATSADRGASANRLLALASVPLEDE
jgi:DNA-binding Lrp family transcriptional regulator